MGINDLKRLFKYMSIWVKVNVIKKLLILYLIVNNYY